MERSRVFLGFLFTTLLICTSVLASAGDYNTHKCQVPTILEKATEDIEKIVSKYMSTGDKMHLGDATDDIERARSVALAAHKEYFEQLPSHLQDYITEARGLIAIENKFDNALSMLYIALTDEDAGGKAMDPDLKRQRLHDPEPPAKESFVENVLEKFKLVSCQTEMEQTKIEQTEMEQTKIEQTEMEQKKMKQTEMEQTEMEQTEMEQTEMEQTEMEQTKMKQTETVSMPPSHDIDIEPEPSFLHASQLLSNITNECIPLIEIATESAINSYIETNNIDSTTFQYTFSPDVIQPLLNDVAQLIEALKAVDPVHGELVASIVASNIERTLSDVNAS